MLSIATVRRVVVVMKFDKLDARSVAHLLVRRDRVTAKIIPFLRVVDRGEPT